MDKKEISEIKSLYDSVGECGITTLAGCYVNGSKEKIACFSETFLALPEEEIYKYLDIFRKTLSGSVGKSLINMEFCDAAGGNASFGRSMLSDLYRSELKDDGLIDDFYDAVIGSYEHTGNYLILLIHQNYDVPGKTTDGFEMEDASEEVYRYMLCSICPMNLTKPGLGFDDSDHMIHTLKQSWGVDQPDVGFLYPAFNDRSSDESQLLFYTKKTDILQHTLLSEVLDVKAPLPAKHQKEGFTGLVAEVLGEDADMDTVIALHDNLADYVNEQKEETGESEIRLDRAAVKNIFENSGLDETQMAAFDESFDDKFDIALPEGSSFKVEERISADNIIPAKKYEVKNSDIDLKISTGRSDIIKTRMIDGVKCLVIEVTDDLTVNGIPVK